MRHLPVYTLDLETRLNVDSIAFDSEETTKSPIEQLAFPTFRDELKAAFKDHEEALKDQDHSLELLLLIRDIDAVMQVMNKCESLLSSELALENPDFEAVETYLVVFDMALRYRYGLGLYDTDESFYSYYARKTEEIATKHDWSVNFSGWRFCYLEQRAIQAEVMVQLKNGLRQAYLDNYEWDIQKFVDSLYVMYHHNLIISGIEVETSFEDLGKIDYIDASFIHTGVLGASMYNGADVYADNVRMLGNRGHGIAAERANHLIDTGSSVTQLTASLCKLRCRKINMSKPCNRCATILKMGIWNIWELLIRVRLRRLLEKVLLPIKLLSVLQKRVQLKELLLIRYVEW